MTNSDDFSVSLSVAQSLWQCQHQVEYRDSIMHRHASLAVASHDFPAAGAGSAPRS